MKQYFYDNAEQNLYVFDGETEELKILPRLRVRVVIGLTDAEDDRARSGIPTGGAARVRNNMKRTITCKNCGQTGHQMRKCPNPINGPLESDADY